MVNYTVWVGGIEYNAFYLTKSEAQALASDLINDGYDDVQIEKVEV
jgi:hypothetical protein